MMRGRIIIRYERYPFYTISFHSLAIANDFRTGKQVQRSKKSKIAPWFWRLRRRYNRKMRCARVKEDFVVLYGTWRRMIMMMGSPMRCDLWDDKEKGPTELMRMIVFLEFSRRSQISRVKSISTYFPLLKFLSKKTAYSCDIKLLMAL